jgi:hypothetical protein
VVPADQGDVSVTAAKALSTVFAVEAIRYAVNHRSKSTVRYVAFPVMWRPGYEPRELIVSHFLDAT